MFAASKFYTQIFYAEVGECLEYTVFDGLAPASRWVLWLCWVSVGLLVCWMGPVAFQ